MQAWLDTALNLLALPQYGLGTLFVVSFISATLLPLGSEPALFGLLQLNPGLFWPAIGVATLGNTLGGATSWWIGYGASKVADKYSHSSHHVRALEWLERRGPNAWPGPVCSGNALYMGAVHARTRCRLARARQRTVANLATKRRGTCGPAYSASARVQVRVA